MNDTPHPTTPDLRSDPDIPGGIRYDPDLAVHEPAETPGEPSAPSRRRSPLVLFPLGLLVLAIIVYLLFGLIASEGKTSSDYLGEIRMRRADAWQTAYELSRMLPGEDASRRGPRFVPELIDLFKASRDDDPRLRRYLALALGEVRDASAVAVLVDSLGDSDEQTKIYAVWALGAIGDPGAAPALVPLLDQPDPGVRKIAAYALGVLDSSASIGPLRALLNDPVEDVAWNAALALARRGDRSGLPLLARMLDRSYLESVRRPDESGQPRGLTEGQKQEAILNALSAIARLRDQEHLAALHRLRDSDPDLRVRQAAFETLAAVQDLPIRY